MMPMSCSEMVLAADNVKFTLGGLSITQRFTAEMSIFAKTLSWLKTTPWLEKLKALHVIGLRIKLFASQYILEELLIVLGYKCQLMMGCRP